MCVCVCVFVCVCVSRQAERTEFADLSVVTILYRSREEDVKPPEGSVTEALRMRWKHACGLQEARSW